MHTVAHTHNIKGGKKGGGTQQEEPANQIKNESCALIRWIIEAQIKINNLNL